MEKMNSRALLDTNVLMNKAVSKGVIVLPVIEELDKLKGAQGEQGKQARDAIFNIYRHSENFEIIVPSETLSRGDNETVDDYLLRVADQLGLVLHSYDLSLCLKAQNRGIEYKFMGEEDNEKENYSGIIYLTPEQYAELCSSQKYDAPENCYLIYEKAINKIKEGKPVRVPHKGTSGMHVGSVESRNPEQVCLFDALYSESPVILASGVMGSGKSFLMLSYALQELERGHYSKIVVIPNNAFVGDSREIAAVPGGLLEKEYMHLGPLIDLLGFDEIGNLVDQDKLEVMPLAISRGRSITDSIIYVSESQNLSESHIKLLISRVGEGSRIFFDGDYRGQQTDKSLFKRNSGLRLLKKLAHSDYAHMISIVNLIKTERSSTAQLADVLDKMETE